MLINHIPAFGKILNTGRNFNNTKVESMDADRKKIKNLRKQIDKIDQEILKILIKRIRITEKIGRIKKSGHSDILDAKRESEILESLLTIGNKNGIDDRFIRSLWRQIIEYSYKVQEECE